MLLAKLILVDKFPQPLLAKLILVDKFPQPLLAKLILVAQFPPTFVSQAIVVKKTRKNITNISWTYEHYTMMVDAGNHQAYIGVGHYGTGANAMACIVIEFHN